MHFSSDQVMNFEFQITSTVEVQLLDEGKKTKKHNLSARSSPISPPPVLTSLHEKSCLQRHRCEYLYAHCQDRGVCRERRREGEEKSIFLDPTGKLPGAHGAARTERRAFQRFRRAHPLSSPRLLTAIKRRSDRTGAENGAACRRRARLRGGGHRKEAHSEGNSGGKRRVHGVEMLHLLECEPNPIFFPSSHHHLRARSSTWSSGAAGLQSKSETRPTNCTSAVIKQTNKK